MNDTEKCCLCDKEIDWKRVKKAYWSWGEEPAHRNCVKREATGVCQKHGYYGYFGDECAECGKPLKLRNTPPKASCEKDDVKE
jgi:hypothetical protein